MKFNPAIGMINPDTDSPEQIIRANIDNMVKTEVTKVYLAPIGGRKPNKAYDEHAQKSGEDRDETSWKHGRIRNTVH